MVGTIAITTAVGGLAGIVLPMTLMAAPTGIAPTSGCGPSTLVRDAGFDAWTGRPRGQIIEGRCMDHAYVSESPAPAKLIGRTGVPWASALTGGFALCGLLAGWVASRLERSE